MPKKHPQPVDIFSLLDTTSGTLAQISAKTNFLKNLADIVRHICPDLPADAWHIANFRENVVIFEVKSSIWGQRLQFERTNLARALSEASNGVFNQITIKVNPHWARAKTAATPVAPARQYTITSSTAGHLQQLAEQAPAGLKEKLLRLAKLSNPEKDK